MQFALNYSPEAVQLQQANQIQVDLFKLPDWADLIEEKRQQHPVYVHFSLVAGSPQKEPRTFDFIESVLRDTHTEHVNLHLGVWRDVIPDSDILDVSPATIEQVTQMILDGVKPFVAHFGKERVIGENLFALDRSGGMVMQASTLPQVIKTVIEETGIGLLLDTAHAKMAAFTHGIPAQDYISALPVERLHEVHVTGIGYRQDGRLGDHLPMRDDDWALYEWVMSQVHHNPRWQQPHLVACEYGGIGEIFRPFSRADVIQNQIPRMVRALTPEALPIR